MAEKEGLNASKKVVADILGQATAMGVHMNEQDIETRDNLFKEVTESQTKEENPLEPPTVEELDKEPGERVVESLKGEADEKFVLDPEEPDDLKEELEEPDFNQEAEQELGYDPPEEARFEDVSHNMEQGYEDWEELDPEVLEERKRRIAAEKKAAWYEKQRVKSQAKEWGKEAQEHYPLAAAYVRAGHIKAKTRKDFLRQAREVHKSFVPFVEEVIELRDKTLDEERRVERERARRDAIKAWGRPTTGTGVPDRSTKDYEGELANSRATGDLVRSIGILRKKAMAEAGLEED